MCFMSIIQCFLKPSGITAHLMKLKDDSLILDVGCANGSCSKIKKILPRCYYHCIDINKQNINEMKKINDYTISSSRDFSRAISRINREFDCIISKHNLEHCEDWKGTLNSMIKKVKVNGYIYLSFPSSQSTNYPSRKGTLNFYDDSTHNHIIDSHFVIDELVNNSFEIMTYKKKYQPIGLYFIGFLVEPFSKLFNKVLIGTWEYYGFETIIIARKIKMNE